MLRSIPAPFSLTLATTLLSTWIAWHAVGRGARPIAPDTERLERARSSPERVAVAFLRAWAHGDRERQRALSRGAARHLSARPMDLRPAADPTFQITESHVEQGGAIRLMGGLGTEGLAATRQASVVVEKIDGGWYVREVELD